jgi:hypothetical protein
MKNDIDLRFRRNIFTRSKGIWNDPDRLDALVLKMVIIGGILALFFPWGQP